MRITTPSGGGSAVAQGRVKNGSTVYYQIPGAFPISVATLSCAQNIIRYAPMLVATPITLDQLACEVTTAGGAATTLRMGIYNADTDWQPTSLVVDAGTVAADSTGVKTASISTTLAAGRYLLAMNTDANPVALRNIRHSGPIAPIYNTIGASPLAIAWRVAQAYGSLPSTGVAWTLDSGSGVPFDCVVFCRVSTP